MLNKNISVYTRDLFDCKTDYLNELFCQSLYPWEIVSQIGELTKRLVSEGICGFEEIAEGVLVGKGCKISPTATIIPPAIFGEGCEIRPGAYIRGNVIVGKNCVIGNSTEMKNCILLDNVQVPHYNYIGDSVLGNNSHMGAGAVCSNFKADGKNVVVHSDEDYETGLRKLGAILGDGADIGCGSVLNPGTIVGKNTSVYPLTPLRGVYGSGLIVKDKDNVVERI